MDGPRGGRGQVMLHTHVLIFRRKHRSVCVSVRTHTDPVYNAVKLLPVCRLINTGFATSSETPQLIY